MIHIEHRLTRLLLGYIISFLFILVNNLTILDNLFYMNLKNTMIDNRIKKLISKM